MKVYAYVEMTGQYLFLLYLILRALMNAFWIANLDLASLSSWELTVTYFGRILTDAICIEWKRRIPQRRTSAYHMFQSWYRLILPSFWKKLNLSCLFMLIDLGCNPKFWSQRREAGISRMRIYEKKAQGMVALWGEYVRARVLIKVACCFNCRLSTLTDAFL